MYVFPTQALIPFRSGIRNIFQYLESQRHRKFLKQRRDRNVQAKFSSAHFDCFRSASANLFHCIQRKIDKQIFFFILRHRGADRNFGIEFLTVGFQALCFQIDLRLDLHRHDLLTGINNKIHLAGSTVVCIVVNAQIVNGFKLLAYILPG